MSVKLKSLSLATAAALALSCGTAPAATTTTGNLVVTATVLDTCIVTGTVLAFASVTPSVVTNETVPGQIAVVCTATRSGLKVTLDAGGSASSGQRRMYDGISHYLPYTVHSDAGHASPVAANGEIYNGGITSAIPLLIPVYGQVPAGSYSAGLYTDTVVVTLAY